MTPSTAIQFANTSLVSSHGTRREPVSCSKLNGSIQSISSQADESVDSGEGWGSAKDREASVNNRRR